MIKHGEPPYLECSSAGDKRFSAFWAKLGDKSIEERIEELMKRDLDSLLKTEWFREKIAGGYFEIVANKLKSEDGEKNIDSKNGDKQ